MGFSQSWIATWYGLLAPVYDLANTWRFAPARRGLVASLDLAPGAVVLDIGCGTGANLELLASAVGPAGRVIGIEFSEPMLARARRRVLRGQLHNVTVVHGDATSLSREWVQELAGERQVDAVISTLVLSVIPGWREVFARMWDTVRAGGRIGILDVHPQTGVASLLTGIENWLAAADIRRPTWTLLQPVAVQFRRQNYRWGTIHVVTGQKPIPAG